MGSHPWEDLLDTYRWPWLACLPCPAGLTPQPHWSRQPHGSRVTFVTFGTLKGNSTLVNQTFILHTKTTVHLIFKVLLFIYENVWCILKKNSKNIKENTIQKHFTHDNLKKSVPQWLQKDLEIYLSLESCLDKTIILEICSPNIDVLTTPPGSIARWCS